MNTASNTSERHRLQVILYLSFGGFVSILTLLLFYRIAHFPYVGYYSLPGINGEERVLKVDPGSPGDLAGLQPGDEVIWIEDQPFFGEQTLLYLVHIYFQPNKTFKIRYKRGEDILTGSLAPQPRNFPYTTLLAFIFSMVLLILSVFDYLRNPLELYQKVSYLLLVCIVPSPLLLSDFRTFFDPIGLINGFFCIFLFPLLLHFVIIFPEPRKIIVKYPFLIKLIYLPVLICLAGIGIFGMLYAHMSFHGVNGHFLFRYILATAYSITGLGFFYLTISIICSIFKTINSMRRGYSSYEKPEIIKQLRWILYGGCIAFILAVLGAYEMIHDYPLILSGGRPIPFKLFLAIFIMFIVIHLSLIKFALMEIDTIIHRSLSYFIVSSIVVLVYFVIFGFLSWLFNILTGKNVFATYLVSALMVAFMFRPLLNRIEQGVDRIFFREKYELHKALETYILSLIAVRNYKDIFKKVYDTVDSTLHIVSGVLWLPDEDENVLKYQFSLPEETSPPLGTMAFDHPLALYFIKTLKGLTFYQVCNDKLFIDKAEFQYFFKHTNMAVLLPLIYENKLIGMIGFGRRRSGDIYSTQDVGLLTTLAHQTAVAIENARAYQRTEALNLKLAEKVEQIEAQQDEINALQKSLLNENIYLREEIKQQCNFDEIIGTSAPMKEVLAMVEKIAPTLSTVLIQGESGTGKELIARAIHFNSQRQDAPFIKVNCAAIPDSLLESELFGHEKGAFTGAVKQKTGKFELAKTGTLFLDEIGDMALDLQAKILRVLQEKEFERVGGTKTLKADVRIIAATNKDMEKAISTGTFREDLFYRLNVIAITLPPLRDRKEDIRELTIHFLKKFSRQMGKTIVNIHSDAINILKSYRWPGNVRELANVIERSVVLGDGDTLSAADLPQFLAPSQPSTSPLKHAGTLSEILIQIERQYILDALKEANDNKSEAARILGIKRTTLNSKLRKFDIL